ncbi:MAG: iron donor protein CyaY [Betaproteobacteria bacterium]
MTETEFLSIAQGVLDQIETAIEQAADGADVDIECARSGNVLEIEFIANRSKMIINTQAPMQEIWVAARAGGFHFRLQQGQWCDTRDGGELFAALSKLASEQAAVALSLNA